MSIPAFLNNPDENIGIIRQIIFPRFRGINSFLTEKEGNTTIFKKSGENIVQFNQYLKSPNLVNSGIIDIPAISQIYYELIVEVIVTLGMSEYLGITKDQLMAFFQNSLIKNSDTDTFGLERLMNEIFNNYVLLVISSPLLSAFIPVFTKGTFSNPPSIKESEESEYYKYLNLLSGKNPNGFNFIKKEEDDAFEFENRIALAFSYIFYYTIKDIFSTSYVQITLQFPTGPQNFGLNILNEMVLDLADLPNQIALNPPAVLEKLITAATEKKILALPPLIQDFELERKLNNSELELADKLTNIYNYINNSQNIPVIKME